MTRDSVEVPWQFRGRPIKLVDTAGIRKYSKRDHNNQIENLSVRDAFRSIESAQVVVVVVDMSEEKLIHMDLTIAQRVIEEGRALILAANKSDLHASAEVGLQRIRDELENSLAQVRGVPVVPISALTGAGIRKLLPEVYVYKCLLTEAGIDLMCLRWQHEGIREVGSACDHRPTEPMAQGHGAPSPTADRQGQDAQCQVRYAGQGTSADLCALREQAQGRAGVLPAVRWRFDEL